MDDADPACLFGIPTVAHTLSAPPRASARYLEPVVAIPVRNEAARLGRCLDALAAQTYPAAFGPLTVVLVLNNCTDDSVAVAERWAAHSTLDVRIQVVHLPPAEAHVGKARRLAMDGAALLLEGRGRADGAILTTDADTVVARDWVLQTLKAFAAGADVVAGSVHHVAGEPLLPRHLRDPLAREQIYRRLMCSIAAQIDPLAHDPWPRHDRACGASLAVRLSEYRRVGGLPVLGIGEDRALVQALSRIDARVRHSLEVRVATSCRLVGRAQGGFADTLARQSLEIGPWCDTELETPERFVRRMTWRRRLRTWRAAGGDGAHVWADRLNIAAIDAEVIALEPHFGRMWERIESASPCLAHEPVTGAGLRRATERARRLLHRLAAGRRGDSVDVALRG